MLPRDTTVEAREAQLRRYRCMTPAQRLVLAFEMCDAARTVTSAGIRHRNPGWTDAQVRAELHRILRASVREA